MYYYRRMGPNQNSIWTEKGHNRLYHWVQTKGFAQVSECDSWLHCAFWHFFILRFYNNHITLWIQTISDIKLCQSLQKKPKNWYHYMYVISDKLNGYHLDLYWEENEERLASAHSSFFLSSLLPSSISSNTL